MRTSNSKIIYHFKELNDFIAKSGDAGFILFSLGSTIPGNLMPLNMQKIFIEAFSKLPQRVLWKLEQPVEELNLPENVMVRPWLPQQDLLGAPPIKITNFDRSMIFCSTIHRRGSETEAVCYAGGDVESAGGRVARRPCHLDSSDCGPEGQRCRGRCGRNWSAARVARGHSGKCQKSHQSSHQQSQV